MAMPPLARRERTEAGRLLMLGAARWTHAIAAGALLLVVAACSGGGSGASAGSGSGSSPASAAGTPAAAVSVAPAVSSAGPSDAGSAAASGAGGAASGNDRCARFTAAQVNTLTADAPFQTAEPAMLDVPGCQWYFGSGTGNVNLQVLPGSQYADWSGKPGVTAVSGLGDSAFVGPFPLGGTMAGAQAGGNFYFLTVSPAPSNDVVVAFLKQAIAQVGGS
jgi:hypothetical protein